MKEIRVESLSLPKGLRCLQYETIAELETAAKEAGATLKFANKYLVEKGALVEGRDVLSTTVETVTGFKWLMKTVEKKNKAGVVSKVQVPDETDREFLNRFRAAVVKGEFNWPGGTKEVVTGTDPAGAEVKKAFTFPAVPAAGSEDNVFNWLQDISDMFGPYAADAAKPVREAKLRKLPDLYRERAEVIFANGNEKKWMKTMKTENIPLEWATDADLVVAKAKNVEALGWAIKAREDNKRKAAAQEYA